MCLDGAALPGDPVPREFLGAAPPGSWGSFSAGLVGPKKQQQLKALPKSRDETGPVHHWGQD